MRKRHLGTVKKGKFIPNNSSSFKMEFYKREGKKVFVAIEPFTRRKTDPQRKYYWAVILDILSDYSGHTPDEMHEALKHKFLTEHNGLGKLDRIKSTEELTTVECEQYYEKIRRWAAQELSLYIPEPNEVQIK